MFGGFITINRKITDWQWYKYPVHSRLFIHCLIKANFKDNKLGRKIIKRGSFVTSCEILASELGYTKKTILRALVDLEVSGELTRKTCNKGTTITIRNYSDYQEGGVNITPQSTPQSTPPSKRQVPTNNNVNKETKKTISNIVDYLNNATGKNYKASTDKTKKLITSLLKRGYTFENFTHVIDVKCQEWDKDEKMKNYLRPETLFGSKFESYLNQEKKITEKDVLRMLEEL